MKRVVILIVVIILQGYFSFTNAQLNRCLRAEKQFKNIKYKKALSLFLKEYPHCGLKTTNKLDEKIANCYRLLGDSKNAKIWYEKVVEQDATDKINFFYYAQILQISGQYEEAKHWFEKYAATMDDNNFIWNFLMEKSTIKTFEKEAMLYDIKLLFVNSDYSDMAPALYEDQLVFSSNRNANSIIRNGWDNEPFFDLYTVTENQIDSMFSINEFDKKINSPYHEGPLCFNSRQDLVYFTRSDYNNGKRGKSRDNVNKLNIYQATKDKKGWKDVEKLWFNSTEHSTGHPAISPNGLLLVFCSDMDGGYGGTDLYFSFWNDTAWSEPINLGKKINTPGNELFPHFSSDGILYFSSNGRQGFGGLDIYYTWPSFENIQHIKNLGMPINSTYDDFGLIIKKNGSGYFSSNRPNEKFKSDNLYSFTTYHRPVAVNDTMEIELTAHLNDKIVLDIFKNDIDRDKDLNLRSARVLSEGLFDREFSINLKGEFEYWVNKSFDGVKRVDYEITDARGFIDTASIYIYMEGNTPPNANPDKLFVAKDCKGTLINVLKNDYDKDNNIQIDSVEIIKTPRFGGNVECKKGFVYYQPPTGFIGLDYCIYKIKDSRGAFDIDTLYIEVMPEFMGRMIAVGGNLDLNIHFKTNEYKVDYLESKKLDDVVQFLHENPSIRSQVIGHTDPVGGTKYNMDLSVKRAKSTANYLYKKGIETERLEVKGKGESELIYKSLISSSKDPNNRKNRRTNIKVTDL